MAVYTGFSDGPERICSVMLGSPLLNGMTAMYILMSLSHAAPWVTRFSNWIIRSPDGTSVKARRRQ
jgi:hypothetical protein